MKKVDNILNRINSILTNGNVSAYFSILSKDEILNRINSDLKFIDKYKDKMDSGYVHDSIVSLNTDREYVESISLHIKRELNYLCCISWRYYEGNKEILNFRDGLMIHAYALVRRSEDGREEVFEVIDKVIRTLLSFGEKELIEQIKNLDY